MTRIWVPLAFSLLLSGGASAQDGSWPESVAPYQLAYETAISAGDEAAAMEAAAAAWQAAREARVRPALVGTLAENYGRLALARGENARAYEAWSEAAEISDRSHAPASERAMRWYQASLAAFANSDHVEAQQCALRASRAPALGSAPLDRQLAGDIHYMVAMSSARVGTGRIIGEHARLALGAFEATGRAYDLVYANTYYLSGIANFRDEDGVAAAVDFHLAHQIYGLLDGPERQADADRARVWRRRAQRDLTPEEEERVDAAIAGSAFPEAESRPGIAYPQVVERVEPRYPREAAMRGLEGHVLVQYTINVAGGVEDVVVLASVPPGVFDEVSIEAIGQWRYEPSLLATDSQGRVAETQFSFRLGRGP